MLCRFLLRHLKKFENNHLSQPLKPLSDLSSPWGLPSELQLQGAACILLTGSRSSGSHFSWCSELPKTEASPSDGSQTGQNWTCGLFSLCFRGKSPGMAVFFLAAPHCSAGKVAWVQNANHHHFPTPFLEILCWVYSGPGSVTSCLSIVANSMSLWGKEGQYFLVCHFADVTLPSIAFWSRNTAR